MKQKKFFPLCFYVLSLLHRLQIKNDEIKVIVGPLSLTLDQSHEIHGLD